MRVFDVVQWGAVIDSPPRHHVLSTIVRIEISLNNSFHNFSDTCFIVKLCCKSLDNREYEFENGVTVQERPVLMNNNNNFSVILKITILPITQLKKEDHRCEFDLPLTRRKRLMCKEPRFWLRLYYSDYPPIDTNPFFIYTRRDDARNAQLEEIRNSQLEFPDRASNESFNHMVVSPSSNSDRDGISLSYGSSISERSTGSRSSSFDTQRPTDIIANLSSRSQSFDSPRFVQNLQLYQEEMRFTDARSSDTRSQSFDSPTRPNLIDLQFSARAHGSRSHSFDLPRPDLSHLRGNTRSNSFDLPRPDLSTIRSGAFEDFNRRNEYRVLPPVQDNMNQGSRSNIMNVLNSSNDVQQHYDPMDWFPGQ
eukprot:TRINITY_DN8978_c0_g1_i1.p1 TRINITY_DN8978_c0_g1~~TRINITY_DN8978_c0_g1_i1.p1  ORF type:complete len:365 (-),score=36.45 TRINITY_DN8978_c0_g1_i1:118-1212(-)